MFYQANDIETIFKCGFCSLKFLNVVKLVPECGTSICGECHDSLKETMDESGQFKCQACHQSHDMPSCGLTDVKSIMKALQLKPEEKGLTKQEAKLRTSIQEVHEKLSRLKQFDQKDAINTYCDELQLEVMETVESVVKQADQNGKELIKTINEYRQDLLKAFNIHERVENEASSGISNESSLDQLEEAFVQINALKEKWDRHFNQIKKLATEAEVNKALEEVQEHEVNLNRLDQTLFRSMFKSRILKFKSNTAFLSSKKFLGELVYENAPEGNVAKGPFSLEALDSG